MYSFNLKITKWYKNNFRPLPWRTTKDPYLIWISEVILQQTRIEQGLPYYEKFIIQFPNIESLARANEEDVLRLWQGLGYYSRARNMHAAAKQIMSNFKGKFPDNHADIIKLKGVGSYTAAAISSIAFNEKKVAVDGNVYRFATRYFGIYEPINTKKCENTIVELISENLSILNMGDFNQALIEIGALICKPKSPLCLDCPVNETCFALRKNKIEALPVKNIAQKKAIRFFNYYIFSNLDELIIQQRTENDIWKGLYEFPLIESKTELSEEKLKEIIENQFNFEGVKSSKIRNLFEVKHILTHQLIFARFWEIDAKYLNIVNPNALRIKTEEIDKYPISRLVELFCQKFLEANT